MSIRTTAFVLLAALAGTAPRCAAQGGAPGGAQAGAAPRAETTQAPDRLVLKTGAVITGKIEKLTTRVVTFQITGKGTVQLPRTRIRAIQPQGRDVSIYGVEPQGPEGGTPRDHAAPNSYIRYDKGRKKQGVKGTLSTGVSRWYHPATKTTMFLVGAVHIGEQSYYDRVQEILDQTDVVLFEAVQKGDDELTEEQIASMTALGKMQIAMKDALGLEFQRDAMQYKRDFWKNADVDFATLQKHMKAHNARLPTDNPLVRGLLSVVTTLISGANKNPRANDLLRGQLAPVLAQADRILATKMKNVSDSLIIFRNEKAMEFVQQELKDGPKGRWLSLFYGAGHLPDINSRMIEDGWKYQGSDWVTAWHFTGR
jgi:hypothetical protein